MMREIAMKRHIGIAKCLSLLAFLVLLFTTYFLRSEVLDLTRIRFSAENVRADETAREVEEGHTELVAEYEARTKNYEVQMKHYRKMLRLYSEDYDKYVQRLQDKYAPPQIPRKPSRPRPPEVSEKLAAIDGAFRRRQHEYFDKTSRMNWVACGAALALVGGLLYLLMFDIEGKRLFYVVILVLSFVFMIGPSFHSILSGIVSLMRPPSMF
jgi:hypothetical protein